MSVCAFCPAPAIRPTRIANFRRHPSTSRIPSQSRTRLSTPTDTETLSKVDLSADMTTVQRLTETAIFQTSSTAGLEALRILSRLCQQRLPFVFNTTEASETIGSIEMQKKSSSEDIARNADGVSLIRTWENLLSPSEIASIKAQIQSMEENGFWSTNPDSVDGLPSFHLNLVSDGKPLFPIKGEIERKQDGEDDNSDFERGVQDLTQLVYPAIYKRLLPKLQQDWLATSNKSTSLQVSDIFVRRYGRDLEDAGIEARRGISAHYDVYSKVTTVVALDDIAAEGTNGLYTTYSTYEGKQQSERSSTSISSNHAALRRFVPLKEGDGVIHTWDILHGVDVEPGLDRTSLIVWFTESSVLQEADQDTLDDNVDPRKTDETSAKSMVSPWLLRHPHLESDDVAQFVLASALSSSTADKNTSGEEPNEKEYQHELYLQSAETGNSFALTRVGSLIEEGALTLNLMEKAKRIADRLRSVEALPLPMQKWQYDEHESSLLAMRFWLEAAVRGNPLAQKALADELIILQSSEPDHDSELNTLAATLFALAAQQGDEDASDSMSRVIDFAVQNEKVQSQEEFLALDTVQVANAAISS